MFLCLAGSLCGGATALAGGIPGIGLDTGIALDEVVITASRTSLVGRNESASEGTVLSAQLENRPMFRPGEVLEVVPGLVVTQHSGDGKANQYFLRGFNLDHGTDFATRVDGIPVNMPTHAHGQGYSDLNFMIPEFVDRVEYKKGTYYAEEGNFSAAGAADIHYKQKLDQPLMLSLSGGQDGYDRAVIGSSTAVAGGNLLLGAEYSNNDGPWDLKEGYRKLSELAKYSRSDPDQGIAVTAMGYDGHWRSTDQIPLRAVESGVIDRFGSIDPTDGGRTHRYSLSAEGWRHAGGGRLDWNVYGLSYQLDLVSNFTYALDQVHGDQFEQYDSRQVYGGAAAYELPLSLFGHEGSIKTGLQARYDDISPVGLYRTQQGTRYSTVREDRVKQASIAGYVSQTLQWTPWLRSDIGLRTDEFNFDVKSDLPSNSGTAAAHVVSPKLSLVFGPWSRTDYFLNVGRGFHSNDARGTTIKVDPNDGVTPVEPVSPLVRAVGGEVGLRTAIIPQLQVAVSLWTLQLDSELLFTGDGGTTEPSRATRRRGVELGLYYSPLPELLIDADFARSLARFTDFDAVGDHIPNAVENVISVGMAYNHASGFYGGARLRYFGPAPLVEDNSLHSSSTMLVNADVGYHFNRSLSVNLSVFNLLDRRDNDITYAYESQLRGEAAPVTDIHFHPVEPRTVRVALVLKF